MWTLPWWELLVLCLPPIFLIARGNSQLCFFLGKNEVEILENGKGAVFLQP